MAQIFLNKSGTVQITDRIISDRGPQSHTGDKRNMENARMNGQCLRLSPRWMEKRTSQSRNWAVLTEHDHHSPKGAWLLLSQKFVAQNRNTAYAKSPFEVPMVITSLHHTPISTKAPSAENICPTRPSWKKLRWVKKCKSGDSGSTAQIRTGPLHSPREILVTRKWPCTH